MSERLKDVVIEGARIFARNFKGEEIPPNNPRGRRNFCVELPIDLANEMAEEGWNVKWPGEGAKRTLPFLPVAVSYENYPPKIFKITSHGQTLLTEDMVAGLDDDEFANVDVIIRPYSWNVNHNSGVKAYVKSMYVTIVENQLAQKYGY